MNTKTTNPEAMPIETAFLQLMQKHRAGDCLHELGVGLRELTKAVQLNGKGGTITLKISVKPASNIKGAVSVSDDITVKAPKLEKGGSLFYADSDGALHRDDPNQKLLELRTVSGGQHDGAVELKKVDA
jgi:hypothetical protein